MCPAPRMKVQCASRGMSGNVGDVFACYKWRVNTVTMWIYPTITTKSRWSIRQRVGNTVGKKCEMKGTRNDRNPNQHNGVIFKWIIQWKFAQISLPMHFSPSSMFSLITNIETVKEQLHGNEQGRQHPDDYHFP